MLQQRLSLWIIQHTYKWDRNRTISFKSKFIDMDILLFFFFSTHAQTRLPCNNNLSLVCLPKKNYGIINCLDTLTFIHFPYWLLVKPCSNWFECCLVNVLHCYRFLLVQCTWPKTMNWVVTELLLCLCQVECVKCFLCKISFS